MTIAEAVAKAKRLRPGMVGSGFTVEDNDLVGYLAQLDMQIDIEIIRTHKGAPEGEFEPYDPSAEGYDAEDIELLVPAPYDKLYIPFLLAQIDRAYKERADYNDNFQQFNADYREFVNYYNRTHMPIQRAYIAVGRADNTFVLPPELT